MMIKKTLLILGIILGVVCFGYKTSVSALVNSAANTGNSAASNSGEALEIAPPLLYLTANPGQTIQAKIYLRDISSSPLLVSGTANDFVASGLNGTPKILFHETSPDPYSLKSYIAPIQSLLLQPKQLKILYIKINVPANASPGGHYGVIRFTGTPPSLNGGNGVSLSASIGALILLTVNGNIVENLNVHQFSVSQNGQKGSFFQSTPLQFSEILQNTGNEHVQPTGLLTIKDMFNHKLVVMDINRRQGNVLPGSMRQFTQLVNSNVVGNKQLFGRYTASINMTYGTSKKTLYAQLTFWVIPVKLIILAIVILIGGFFLLRWLIRRYNQYILDKAQKSKPRKSK